jgi:phenylacetate-CoA ligase
MPLLFRLEDWISGTRKHACYRALGSWVGKSPAQIRAIQEEKLRKLARHAYQHIPWYRQAFEQAGLTPAHIRSGEDLPALPILSRDDIRDNLQVLMQPNFSGKVVKSSSSGTTGIPIVYYHDMNALSAGVAAIHRLYDMCGFPIGARNVHVWGNMASIQRWRTLSSQFKQLVYRKKNVAAPLLNDPANIPRIVRQIQRFKPRVIDGYSNSLYVIAQYLRQNDLRIPSLRLVVSTGENLDPHQQQLIEQVMAPVADLYGCSEVNGVAIRPPHVDRYYIFEPHVLVETQPVPGQKMREILVTDLDNYFMPLIRYKIGDMIDDIQPARDDAPFPFAFFTKLYGRSTDHVALPGGVKLFPVNIFGGTLYRKYPQITRHQVIWNKRRLRFVFETQQPLEKSALEADIKASLREYQIDYQIEYTSKLPPGKNGKHQYFVREDESAFRG